MDYLNTPSFYIDEEFFKRYLGRTSYYLSLQRAVDKVVEATGAQSVLELGSALGTTMLMLADKYRSKRFLGVDMREDVVQQATQHASENSRFIACDMCEFVKGELKEYDLIYLLYSFHHILDPLEEKETFLRNCFKNMKQGAYLFITETFLPENEGDHGVEKLFEQRAKEGYASTFWESFHSIAPEGLEASRQIANTSAREEAEAGRLVLGRDNEYLVTFEWLKKTCDDIGFETVFAEPVNCIMEKAILLRR